MLIPLNIVYAASVWTQPCHEYAHFDDTRTLLASARAFDSELHDAYLCIDEVGSCDTELLNILRSTVVESSFDPYISPLLIILPPALIAID
jgi:hypothetical protein